MKTFSAHNTQDCRSTKEHVKLSVEYIMTRPVLPIPVLVDFLELTQARPVLMILTVRCVSNLRNCLKQFLAAARCGYKYYDLLARSRPIISITAWKEAPDV